MLEKAITATARKLAVLVYRTLKDRRIYADPGAMPPVLSWPPKSLNRPHERVL